MADLLSRDGRVIAGLRGLHHLVVPALLWRHAGLVLQRHMTAQVRPAPDLHWAVVESLKGREKMDRLHIIRLALLAAPVFVAAPLFAEEPHGALPNLTPSIEAAKAVTEHAKRLREQRLTTGVAAPSQVGGGGTAIKRREGVFFFVSWSIPEPELKPLLREAFRLGATVVFRGLLHDGMKATVERTKTLAIELDREAPHIVLDPVIFEQFRISAVPALAIARDQQALIVEGEASLKYLLTILTREEPDVSPILSWFEGQTRGWEFGGPSTDLRPLMPTLTGIRTIPTDLKKYPILERDMREVLRDLVRNADMDKFRRALETKVKKRLKDGPALSLPVAPEFRRFSVDLTQRIDHDIPNHDGSAVVVKAGTVVNPLSYVTYRHRLVVIDGRDARQVEFARRQIGKYGAYEVKVLLTEGDFAVVSTSLQDRVYWLQPDMVTRFQLAHVPSVITQNGPLMQVEEFRL
ncbi:MAG: hypothetical protein OJF50_006463 [Nitrospira sp.]|jgi:conjugal transfer pilus assembly protein TraW|nr:hypothetical protein [Nitrospira sp.]